MNKSDLVDAVAASADVTKASAGRAVDAVLDSIGDALGKQDTVSLVGFGTFSVRHRAAREGRNPQTGSTIKNNTKKSKRKLKIIADELPHRQSIGYPQMFAEIPKLLKSESIVVISFKIRNFKIRNCYLEFLILYVYIQ